MKKYLKPFTSWKFLVSFGSAWMITNGWAYVLAVVHTPLQKIALGYIAFLYLPFTPEKLITIPLAIFIHTKMFKNDDKTRKDLEEMYEQAKTDWKKIKNKFRKK
jgi:hypothetical protein